MWLIVEFLHSFISVVIGWGITRYYNNNNSNNNNTLLQTRWTYQKVHESCPIHSKYIVYKSTTTEKSVTTMRRVDLHNIIATASNEN